MLRVTGVTSWGAICGVSEYAKHLKEACEVQALPVTFDMDAKALDPVAFVLDACHRPEVLWLNYHMGLHSRWTPEIIQRVRRLGVPVVLTLHDTYDGVDSPNSDRALALAGAASATIVHEPVGDIEQAIVLRQGIPDLGGPYLIDQVPINHRPILGTVGFPFPWKNYDRLAALTAELGWALCLFAPTATQADVDRWTALNPWMHIEVGFEPSWKVIGTLNQCTATAFMYECGNSGTSGAIRQGIAARKPVFALRTCRQFRDLLVAEEQEGGETLIHWVDDWNDLRWALKHHRPFSVDPKMVYLAERDSWRRQARAYLEVFERAVGGGR